MDPKLNEELVLADWRRAENTARDLGIRLLKREGVRLFFAIRVPGGEERAFVLECDGYPEAAPAVHFVDARTLDRLPTAFPRCITSTRQYYQLHPEALHRPGIDEEWRIARTLATVFSVVRMLPPLIS